MSDTLPLEELDWAKAYALIATANPDLASALDRTAGDTDAEWPRNLRAYLCSYRFGEYLLTNGAVKPPEGTHQPNWAETIIPSDGPSIPLCLVLSGEVEVFTEDKRGPGADRKYPASHPHRVLGPGELFGLFEVADHLSDTPPAVPPRWSATAGPRTVHVIAPLKDQRIRAMLRKKHPMLRTLLNNWWVDPWGVLHQLARAADPAWTTKILVFLPTWLVSGSDNRAALRAYLLGEAWRDSAYARSERTVAQSISAWAERAKVETGDKRLTYGHVIDAVQHIASIASGTAVAFRPCHDDKAEGSRLLRRVEQDLFQLMHEATRRGAASNYPAILRPAHLKPGDTGYYSMRLPAGSGGHKVPDKKLSTDVLEPVAVMFSRLREAKPVPAFCSQIDLDRLEFFGHRAVSQADVLPQTELPVEQFIAPTELDRPDEEKRAVLGAGSTFFNAAVSITRKRSG